MIIITKMLTIPSKRIIFKCLKCNSVFSVLYPYKRFIIRCPVCGTSESVQNMRLQEFLDRGECPICSHKPLRLIVEDWVWVKCDKCGYRVSLTRCNRSIKPIAREKC